MESIYKQKINDSVNLIYIENNKFKTNVITVYFKRPLKRDEVTKNSLIPYILKSSTQKYNTPSKLDNMMQELYSTNISASIDKIGEKQIIAFRLSFVSDRYLPETITHKALELLKEVIFFPNIVDDGFDKKYVDIEKEVLAEDIKSLINNKGKYAVSRATDIMFENEPFSIRFDGYIEDLENINEKNLYTYYKEFIKTTPIDIVVAGQFDKEQITNYIKEIFDIKINPVDMAEEQLHKNGDFKQIEEYMDITQGKLVLGYSFDISPKDDNYYDFIMYSDILGGGVYSKLFMNVREKHSLCYSIGSYIQKYKGTMMIVSGIEHENKQKAIDLIQEQMQDIKNGKISDIELESAKKHYLHSLETLNDSLHALSDFYYAQSISPNPKNIEQIKDIVKNIDKNSVQKIAQKEQKQLQYFLTKN